MVTGVTPILCEMSEMVKVLGLGRSECYTFSSLGYDTIAGRPNSRPLT